MKLRLIAQILGFALPWPVRRLWLRWVLSFEIPRSARIGFSLVLADRLVLGEGAGIGHLNYIGILDEVRLGPSAVIGNMNWICGLSRRLNTKHYQRKRNRRSALVLENSSMIGHMHLIDCTDSVEFGPFSGLAGWRSQLLTHGVDPIASRQTCSGIVVGAHSMIGSNSLVTKGVRIPEKCIVAAGSVVNHLNVQPYSLIAGNPAVVQRMIPPSAKFFHRTESVIL